MSECRTPLPKGVVDRQSGTVPPNAIRPAGCDRARACQMVKGARGPIAVGYSCGDCGRSGTVASDSNPNS